MAFLLLTRRLSEKNSCSFLSISLHFPHLCIHRKSVGSTGGHRAGEGRAAGLAEPRPRALTAVASCRHRGSSTSRRGGVQSPFSDGPCVPRSCPENSPWSLGHKICQDGRGQCIQPPPPGANRLLKSRQMAWGNCSRQQSEQEAFHCSPSSFGCFPSLAPWPANLGARGASAAPSALGGHFSSFFLEPQECLDPFLWIILEAEKVNKFHELSTYYVPGLRLGASLLWFYHPPPQKAGVMVPFYR